MNTKSKEQMKDDGLKEKIEKIERQDIDDVLNKEKEISKKVDDIKILHKYSQLVKTLFGMLRDFKNKEYTDVPWKSIAAIAFSLLYIFNPFDIVPDFIPGVGYLDDLTVLTYALKFIENDVHAYLDWKIEQNNQQMQRGTENLEQA